MVLMIPALRRVVLTKMVPAARRLTVSIYVDLDIARFHSPGYGFRNDYYGLEVDCYCPTIDRELDVIGDGLIDCLTQRVIPAANDNGFGYAVECANSATFAGMNAVPTPYQFLQPNLSYDVALNRPFNELDNDEDAYVDCEITGSWRGSLSVVGGDDCDDYDTTVYPNATEVCDGQYNDCTATTNIAVGAPMMSLTTMVMVGLNAPKPHGQLELQQQPRRT